ncbi:hypothetical protein ASG88_15400 [Nocardioides sp. Soil777]|uniref:hypothetical protein n=1 Tax=Nocardioides sp. Soil777 TaxID=1736409 RepID=UPI000703AF74|nr:hypothetical protein [Nocardioides sp. Soil777]KRE99115.1 hypothetical protein ASG88_15400 [Nocardioides sp. Soil777]
MSTPTASTEPQAPPGIDELSARDLLDVATGRRRVRRLAEVDEMLVAAQWAVLHGEPEDAKDPMTQPGGDGTPDVRDYCLAELAMAQETHALTARSLIADTLDLIHRLPRTWAIVQAGDCEPWVARRVAVMTRPLLAETVGLVDRAVARAIAGHAPTTVFSIARAKIIEADPETHAAERERIRHERYVRLSRADEFGYRHLIARVTAGDATWIDAMVDRVADILARTHGHDHNHDELRSLAIGWLARPVDLLKLLLEHTVQNSDDDPDENPGDGSRPAWAPEHLADTLGRLCALSSRKLASLRGRGHLYVHVTDEALRTRTGIARVEGLGPVDITQLADLLGHADVTVQPVLDLRDRRRTDAYEHPEATKDHVWTQTGGDVFPFSPRTATRRDVDFDHSTAYDPTGPPGQTGPHNSGPLRRRHHRWKTHGRYRCRTIGPGRHLWQTPHGLSYLVDHEGTRKLDDDQADLILTAPEGVEIYVPKVSLVL